GISAELPSGTLSTRNYDYKEFFEFLLNKGESYETVLPERFNIDAWKGHNLGEIITQKGSFLKNLYQFNHVEFGITAADARAMALSTCKLVEHSLLSLLDAGIEYSGRNVGCYMSWVTFDIQSIADPIPRGIFAGYPYSIANKVSYHLDLVGPSFPTDTVCSSTVSALHLAVQVLRAGDCETVLIGGSKLNHRLVDWIQYCAGSLLSPDRKCKPFNASANG
ncbi:hypothetical protein M422DRAFT_196002, partial [Sphaerobolus stellatus SS14]